MAPQAPLIIIGDILRHEPDPVPAIAIWVREVLKGGQLDSGMRIQMGDGLHCRPNVEDFPPGSRWVMALNGPGAKPGQGWTLISLWRIMAAGYGHVGNPGNAGPGSGQHHLCPVLR